MLGALIRIPLYRRGKAKTFPYTFFTSIIPNLHKSPFILLTSTYLMLDPLPWLDYQTQFHQFKYPISISNHLLPSRWYHSMCVQNGWTNHFPLCGALSLSCNFSARIIFSHSHLFWSHFIFRLHVFISDNLFFFGSFGWLGISVFFNPGIHIYFCWMYCIWCQCCRSEPFIQASPSHYSILAQTVGIIISDFTCITCIFCYPVALTSWKFIN